VDFFFKNQEIIVQNFPESNKLNSQKKEKDQDKGIKTEKRREGIKTKGSRQKREGKERKETEREKKKSKKNSKLNYSDHMTTPTNQHHPTRSCESQEPF